MRTCVFCNNKYIAKVHNQKYCSSRCKNTANCRKYYKKNKVKLLKEKTKYYENNKESIIKKQLYSMKKRENNDTMFKIQRRLRSRLYSALKNNYKSGSAVKDLGCTVEQFKKHLESQFKDGMSWDNYGRWHIDHIKPLSSFNLKNKEELLKACHYSNLQPLWAKDNISKGNR